MARWTQSIRFRLSLTIAATVFAVGSVLLGGMYAWQVHQIDRPIRLDIEQVTTIQDGVVRRIELRADSDDVANAVVAEFERQADRAMVEELRKGSLVGLGILAVAAFLSGYVLSGLALRPIDRMTMVARDISGTNLARRIGLNGPDDELRRLGDTFDAMLDRLQTAFEDQRRFIQDTSHELRNPLASARTNLELALSDPDASSAELRSAAEVAHRSTERMATLVDDLLDQARTGVPEVELVSFDLFEVAAEVVDDFAAAARSRNLTLTVATPPDGRQMVVRGDRDSVSRAVANLVSNAVRLAPSATVVRVEVVGDDGEVTLKVIDEGPGLSSIDQTQVFRRFWRGENAGAGTGLGLSIVKQITERHGGRVTVESDGEGSGSTFSLVLPICTAAR